MSLHDQIQSLVAKFAQDLEALVRSAAVSAVQSALGAPQPGRASPAPSAGAATRKRGSKPRKGRVRRTSEQIAATANKIHAFVKANPNTSAEAIKKGLAIAKNEWLAPLSLLMEAKRLTSKGQKRATTYTAR